MIKRERIMRKSFLFGLLLSTLLLAGCDVTTPSQVSVGSVRVKEGVKTATLPAQKIDLERVSVISVDYSANGRGAVSLFMPYLDGDNKQLKMAKQQAGVYKKAFFKHGLNDVKVEYVPVASDRYTDEAVVSWRALETLPPVGCEKRMPGYKGAETLESIEKYTFGCEIQTSFSKMISDPSDLSGKGGTAGGDSRRQGAVVERYKSGKPNSALKGLTASDVGD